MSNLSRANFRVIKITSVKRPQKTVHRLMAELVAAIAATGFDPKKKKYPAIRTEHLSADERFIAEWLDSRVHDGYTAEYAREFEDETGMDLIAEGYLFFETYTKDGARW